MRIASKHLVLSFSLMLFLPACSVAQFAGQLLSMKLVTDTVGWASTNNKLFWTTDNGAHWKDITPKLNHKMKMVSSVFFLNPSTGWVLLKCGDDTNAFADDVCFEFASTTDAGEHWTLLHPKIADPGIDQSNIDDGIGLYSGATFLTFADSQHGWAILKKSYNVTRSVGEMLRTEDGGRTWVQLSGNTPPIADAFVFINAKDGWIAGGPDRQLFVSRDAGNSWKEVSFTKPTNVGEDTGVDLSLPVFENQRRGFLSVRYAVGPITGPDLSTLVEFLTDNGGLTWTPRGTLSHVPSIFVSEGVGSILIAAHSELETTPQGSGKCPIKRISLSLFRVGLDRTPTHTTSSLSLPAGAVTQLSFISTERGWITVLGRLFSTDDAGVTWVEVTPGESFHELPTVCAAVN